MNSNLSKEDFAEKWISHIKSKKEGIAITEHQELTVKASFNGQEHTFFLDNAYADYLMEPSEIDHIIELYSESQLEVYEYLGVINPERIVPIIKDNAFLEEVKRLKNTDSLDNVIETYNSELVIIYVEDTEKTVRHLSQKDFKELNISTDTLKEFALANLHDLLPEIEKHGETGYYMVTVGGTYESSLILADDIWTQENFPVQGEIIVGIPSRDLLIVTGSEDPENMNKLRVLINDIHQNGSHIISNRIFIRKNGKFVVHE
ncbi:MAG: DUF1444 family protein [Flavobacteriales bacterium]|nr:DUF1444 family protein [Flavobacteriales bacterium]